MSPITDPERQRKASRECMAKLLEKRKMYQIFGQANEPFLKMMEMLQMDNFKGKPVRYKLYLFKGMKWFMVANVPMDWKRPDVDPIRQAYEMLKELYKQTRLPFKYSFAEFKQGLEVYNRTYEIKCVDE